MTEGASDTPVERYRRAANYLAAAQIYLRANPLLEEPLVPEHLKPRLLGHWGTAPGINLVHQHLNGLILRSGASLPGARAARKATPATASRPRTPQA